MKLAAICCRNLEAEMRAVLSEYDESVEMHVMEWALHLEPDVLLKTITEKIRSVQDRVDAVVLGYGRCQALDRLPEDFRVPVVRPHGEDCIGVLIGQDRYDAAVQSEAGTWFLTPGWTTMGMDAIFRELHVSNVVEKDPSIDPMGLAHRMLDGFTRALFIDVGVGDRDELMEQAQEIARQFGWRIDVTDGTLDNLRTVVDEALTSAR